MIFLFSLNIMIYKPHLAIFNIFNNCLTLLYLSLSKSDIFSNSVLGQTRELLNIFDTTVPFILV